VQCQYLPSLLHLVACLLDAPRLWNYIQFVLAVLFPLNPAPASAMAGTANDFQNGAPFYLDATQQDLLLAALASNNQNPNDLFSTGLGHNRAASNSQFPYSTDNVDPTFFTSPQQSTPANAFSNMGMEESPFVDYLDGDNFDFDNADDDLMIGALPGGSPSGKNSEESNEKRKSPDDDDDEDEGGGKRREGEDKQAKKPGRKPLTSEPTTVGFVFESYTENN
jgi:AP-1-like factor